MKSFLLILRNGLEMMLSNIYNARKKKLKLMRDTIKIIKREKFSGLGFLALTKEDKLIQYCKMPFGAAITIVELAKELKKIF